MYITASVKSLAELPLVWVMDPTLADTPVMVNVATNDETSVPRGTVPDIVWLLSSIIAVISDDKDSLFEAKKLKAETALLLD